MKTLYLRNIKKGFATNSRSYHSTLVMTEEEYKKWKNKEIEVNGYTYGEWFGGEDDDDDYYYDNAEHDTTNYTTPGGEKIIILCKSGYDG